MILRNSGGPVRRKVTAFEAHRPSAVTDPVAPVAHLAFFGCRHARWIVGRALADLAEVAFESRRRVDGDPAQDLAASVPAAVPRALRHEEHRSVGERYRVVAERRFPGAGLDEDDLVLAL